MILLAAAALAASVPSYVDGPPQMEDPGAWTPPPRVVTKLPDATYRALAQRHQPAISWGFLVSGIAIPVGFTGAGIAVWGAFTNSAPIAMFGANLVGVGIAANVTGAVVGMRSMTLYDRELKDLKAGRMDIEDLAREPRCRVRPRLAVNGMGGVF